MDEHEKNEIGLTKRAEKFRSTAKEQLGVEHSLVDIFSDGTRMQGTVWRPKNFDPAKKYPAVVLCHGFGGKRAHLDYSCKWCL
jgi:dipeptidyl aminopeptidase/acylaminoacyl peptidase